MALLLFTSGTTAAPRVTRLTQRNLAAAADSIAGTLRLGPDDRALNMMPLHHGHGIFPGILAPLAAAGATICARPADAEELLGIARATRPTWYSAAPVVHHSVLAMARAASAASVRICPIAPGGSGVGFNTGCHTGTTPANPEPAGTTRLKGRATASGACPGADASNTQMPDLNPRSAQSPLAPDRVANVR